MNRRDARLTALGLGTWAFGGTRWGGAQSDRDSMRTIRRAVELGIGWLDTAGVYGLGRAERVIGRTLADMPEPDRPLVITKGGLAWSDTGREIERVGAPQALRRQCDESLGRLGVDSVDLYLLHWPPADGTPIEEAWGAIAELAAEGKARSIGVSNFGIDLLRRCEAVRHVDVTQTELSLLCRDAEHDVVPWARRHGTAVIAHRPLAGGLLTGAFTSARVKRLPEDDWRSRAPEFRGRRLDHALALVERLCRVAERRRCTIAQLALAWVLSRDGVDAAAVGARSPAQVEGWAGAPGLRLDALLAAELCLERGDERFLAA